MSRCRQALNPKKKAPLTPKELAKPAAEAKKNDFMSMFAVVAMGAKAAEQEAEDAEELEKTDDANARLIA
ncbi:hypothetical protein V8B55DRAFT_1434478 [Mucor lusitanicus]